jgi:hypothetical protein
MILLAVLLGFTFLYLAVSIAAHAETPFAEKRAQCFLQVEGVVHIDGICDLTSTTLPGEPPKGFQIGTGTNERFLARDIAGHDRHYGWFAYVNPNGDGTASASWNGEYGGSHAMTDLPTLHKDGACWVNWNTKICAWKIGERRFTSPHCRAVLPIRAHQPWRG